MTGAIGIAPVQVKALDLEINSDGATIPSLVPRMVERAKPLEAFIRMLQCRSYLGQSLRMWFLDSSLVITRTR